jgi:hypothetical protein
VTASAMLESCMFDVLVTGDRSFANVSAYVQSEVKVTANVTPTTKPTVPKSQPRTSLISKSTGVNYTRLRDLLAAGQWKEADRETKVVMDSGVLGMERIDEFPCEDLRIINQLWLHYSNGKFGFSVQKEIYESLGGKRSSELTFEAYEEAWEKFYNHVGWKRGGSWLEKYSDLTFNLELAPKAHLPRLWFRGGGLGGLIGRGSEEELITTRFKTCNL